MPRAIPRAVQKIQREDSEEKYRQQVETEQFWDDYKKEQDKRKSLTFMIESGEIKRNLMLLKISNLS